MLPAPISLLASFQRLTWLAGHLALLASVGGLFGRQHWVLDGLAHFRWQYAVLLLCASAVAIAARRRAFAGLFGLFFLLNAGLIGRVVLDQSPAANGAATARLRVLVVNLYADNARPERLLPLVEQYRPDIVGVLEFTPQTAIALAPLHEAFPVHYLSPRVDAFGIALWTRLPVARIDEINPGPRGLPTLRMDFGDASGAAQFVLTHPVPPIGDEGTAVRDAQLNAIADEVRAAAADSILAGDLNLTPWSAAYRELRLRSGLFDSLGGHFPRPTWWPRRGVGPAFAVPIDHVLIGANWRCVERLVGPDVGSDHRPLLLTLERATAAR